MSNVEPRRRRTLLCAMPAIGHVDPLLAIGKALAERGWEVSMLTGSRYAERVEQAGIAFLPLPSAADTLDAVGSGERNRGLATINAGVEEAFVRPAYAAARRVEEIIDEDPVDVILHDMTFLGVQGILARPRATRPLVVLCGIGPAGFSSRDCPPYGLGIAPSSVPIWGFARDAALRSASHRLLAPAHRALEDFLRAVDAPLLEGQFFMDVLARSDLLAQLTVPEFEYHRIDAPKHLRFYGPMSPAPSPSVVVPEWLTTLDDRRPLVHVTQGTVANTDFSELIGPTLTALADEPVHVVVTAGGRAAAALPELPANAHAADYLPYDVLLPRTDVFVTNGGYGGLHQAMRHGVPIVIAGDSEDKVETSARVHWSGAGISLRTGHPSPRRVRNAVRRVLRDDRYAKTARGIGDRIDNARGAHGLVDDIEVLMANGRNT